jgi:hypothetical protein
MDGMAAAAFALISSYNSFLGSLPNGVRGSAARDIHLRNHFVFYEAALAADYPTSVR